jgi:hypothetical protein
MTITGHWQRAGRGGQGSHLSWATYTRELSLESEVQEGQGSQPFHHCEKTSLKKRDLFGSWF